MTKRGVFAVFEGLDFSGKTTQSKLLYNKLNETNMKSVHMRFPDRDTDIGKIIDKYLKGEIKLNDQTIHLLFSANRWELMDKIENYLKTGVNVIVDRYSYSGIAYTSAKGLDFDWCKTSDVGILQPDIVFFLDITPKLASERKGYGGEVYEKVDFQTKVLLNYNKLRDRSWKTIKADRAINEIHDEIYNIFKILSM